MIRGITFNEQYFYSSDFAQFENFFLSGYNGIIKGMPITRSGNNVTIGKGYFMIQGRMLCVEIAETLNTWTSGVNQIVYEIDLSKVNTATEFLQGSLKVLQTTDVTQEDLNDGGTLYQWKIAHFNYSGSSISGFVVDAETLVLDNIFAQISANYDVIDAEARAYIQGQVGQIQAMIDALEEQNFEKKAMYYLQTISANGWNDGVYSFESTYPFASYDLEVQVDASATSEQVDAWSGAKPVGSITSNTIKAFGDVPTIDIPVIVRVQMKY